MKKIRAISVIIAVMIAAALILSSCGGENELTPEEKAAAIWMDALKIRQKGDQLDFLREVEKLGQYQETETYAKAKAELNKDGISINTALSSWTTIQMFRIKNDMVAKRKLTHPDGDVMVQIDEEDAWGTPFWVEYSDKGLFKFVLRSAGPDKLLKTEDDLAIFYTEKRPTQEQILAEKERLAAQEAAKEAAKKGAIPLAAQDFLKSPDPAYKEKQKAREKARKETARSSSGTSEDSFGPEFKVNPNGEAVIELDDLLKNQ